MMMKTVTFILITLAFVAVSCRQTDGEQTNNAEVKPQTHLSYNGPKPEDSLGRLGKSSVNAITMAPDGNTVIVGGDTGVFAYSADTLEELWSLAAQLPVISLSVSPDGQLLAAGLENGSAILIDMENRDVIGGSLNATETENGLYSLAWFDHEDMENGQYLALGFNDGNVIMSQIQRSGSDEGEQPEVTYLEHLDQQSSGVVSMAFSPNGRVLATGTRNGTISIWDAGTWQWLGFLEGHDSAYAVSTLAWSDDGRLLLSGGRDDLLILWDMTTFQPRAVIPDQAGDTIFVDFAPDGSSMASASAEGEVSIWDLGGQDPQISSEYSLGELGSIAWSDEWDTIVSATPNGELLSWIINDQSEIIGPKEITLGHSNRGDWVTRVAWDSSGTRLASTLDEDVLVWDTETNSLLQRFTGHDALVGGLDWSRDGTNITSGDADGVIKIWDAASGSELVTADEHSSGITDIRWSPDGTYLASAGSLDDTIVLLDPTSGDVLHRLSGSGSGIWSVGWSPDGDTIAGGTTNGEILFWDLDGLEDGEPSRVMPRHLNWVSGISYSPDGKWIATSGADNRLVLTDLESDRAFTLPGHQGAVRSLEFSPDGKRLVSGAKDNLVIVWDVSDPGADKEPLVVYAGHTDGVNDVRWSPDGQKVPRDRMMVQYCFGQE